VIHLSPHRFRSYFLPCGSIHYFGQKWLPEPASPSWWSVNGIGYHSRSHGFCTKD